MLFVDSFALEMQFTLKNEIGRIARALASTLYQRCIWIEPTVHRGVNIAALPSSSSSTAKLLKNVKA